MPRAIRTELLKAVTTRIVPALVLVAPLIAALAAFEIVSNAGVRGAPSLGTTEHVRRLAGVPALAGIPLLLTGVLLTSGEHRHRTIGVTYLTVPDRARVVAAKAVTAAVIGLAVAVVSALTVALIAVPLEARQGVDLPAMMTPSLVRTATSSVISVPIHALLGVGIGAVVANQVVAAIGSLAWFVLLEQNIVARIVPDVAGYLPSGAMSILAGDPHAPTGVPVTVAVAVIVGWTVLLNVAGAAAESRRDI